MILVSLQSIKYHFLIPIAMKLDEKTYLQIVCFFPPMKFNRFLLSISFIFTYIFFSAFSHYLFCDNLSKCSIFLFTMNPLIFSNSNCLLSFLITLKNTSCFLIFFFTVFMIFNSQLLSYSQPCFP